MNESIKRYAPTSIGLVLVPLLALACEPGDTPSTRRCVDRNHNLVDEKRCKDLPPSPAGASSAASHGSSGSGVSPFLWYYAGTMMGNRMTGGGYSPQPGFAYSSPGGSRYSISDSRSSFSGSSHNSGNSSRGISGGIGAGSRMAGS